MGTEVQYKSSFPGYYSMRNENEDSNNSSWHLFYADNAFTNAHYYDDAYLGHEKDELKQKMLQHEAIFKNQVSELHRLYIRQRDMMDEAKRNEFHKYQKSIDTSSSSNLMPSQKPYEHAHKRQIPSFPKASIFGVDLSISPGSKDCEVAECRPSKVRKKLFDLQLPAHEYVDSEEDEQIMDNQASEISSKETCFLPKNGVKTFLDDGGKKDSYKNTAAHQYFMADLNEPPSVDFVGPSDKSVAFNNIPVEVHGNRRDRFPSCLRESGNSRSNMNYTSHCFESSKLQTPSDTMQLVHGKEFQRGIYLENSSHFQDGSHFNQTPLLFGAYPVVNTSDMGSSWSPFGQSWGKPNDGLTRKLTSFQTQHSVLSSPQNHEVFGDKWHRNSNGFYRGSSSWSKELSARLPSVGFESFDYRNHKKHDDGSQKSYKGSNVVDLTGTTKDMDLNTVQTLSDEDGSRKCDPTALPWLRAKPDLSKNNSSCNQLCKNGDSLGNDKKLLGFLRNDVSSAVSTSASMEHRGIDINVAWDEDDEKREETDTEIKNFKNHFDLNSCVTEDDDVLVTVSVKSSKKKKTMEIDLEAPAVSEIEEEHNQTEPKPDNLESKVLAKIAAEAMIAISNQQDHVGPTSRSANDNDDVTIGDPLLWFVEVIGSCKKTGVSTTHEIDEYENLILQQEESKEEDYMPTPLVPDIEEPDDVGTALTSRPRRGHARRGRPRRDFQRDILPGMTSLSRHEITEDLQIFGGLMRATGHSWNLGSTRRNGKRVGRRRVKTVEETPAATPPPPPPLLSSKQVKNVEVVGLEEGSLTGWGKTTRRPRRQRCAVGNSVAVQST